MLYNKIWLLVLLCIVWTTPNPANRYVAKAYPIPRCITTYGKLWFNSDLFVRNLDASSTSRFHKGIFFFSHSWQNGTLFSYSGLFFFLFFFLLRTFFRFWFFYKQSFYVWILWCAIYKVWFQLSQIKQKSILRPLKVGSKFNFNII